MLLAEDLLLLLLDDSTGLPVTTAPNWTTPSPARSCSN